MKGIEQLREKLPNYKGKRIDRFLIIGFITFLLSLTFQMFMDSLPRILSNVIALQILEPLTPLIGSLIVLIIGLMIVYTFWRSRVKYLNKYGELAYQKAFILVVTGVPMVFSVIVHSFFPTDFIRSYGDTNSFSFYLGSPIMDIFFNLSPVFFYIRLFLSFFFVGLGMAVVSKALKIFGIDYMGLLYVFYPDESILQNHEIYSILRHPTYHTLMLFSIGSIFFRFSIYSIIYFFLFLIGINLHIKLVEEKELIQRFGREYKKYKENVPALFLKIKDFKKYLAIIFKK